MQTRSQTRKMVAKLAATTKEDNTMQASGDLSEQINCSLEQPQEQEVKAVQEQTQKSGEYNDSVKDIIQQEHERAINDGCEDDEGGSEIENHFPEQLQEQEITAVQEQFRKTGEYNDSAKDIRQQEHERAINDGCEDDEHGSEIEKQFPEQPQEQEVTAVQEQTRKSCENNSEDIMQQEHESALNDGYEDDEDSSENEESLLKKAEKSLRANQSTKNGSKMRNEFSFPSLNVGVSINEQLYIKRHPGGIVTLQQDEIIQDSLSKKYKTSSRVVPSLSNAASTTDDNDQDSYAKLSRKEKQKLHESTTGPGWFDMKKPDITPEIKRDLQIIKLRNVLDPKRFYKKDDSKGLPKYFEIGTIKEGPTEFYSSRIPRKERRQTIADELLANEQSRSYFKRKFAEIQEVKQSGGKKYYKQLKAKRKPDWEKSF